MKKVLVVLAAIGLLATMVWAATVYTTTSVQFNVGTVVGFTLTLPGDGGSPYTANSTGVPTAGISFTTATGTDANVDPSVAGGSDQSDGVPIFQYDNTGTVNLNISVSLEADVPVCMNTTGATTFAGADNGAVISSTANTTVVSSYTPAAAAQDWYMKTDFTGCIAGDATARTLTSWGVETS